MGIGGGTAGDGADQIRRRDDADVDHRLVFEAEAVAQLHHDVDGHHQRQVGGEPPRDAQRCGRQHYRHRVGQPLGHDAGGDRTESLGRVLAVGLDVADVVDQVDRRGTQAEHHEGDRDLDEYVVVVVVSVGAPGGQRRGQHQDVLHPLPRAHRLDHAEEQVRPGGVGPGHLPVDVVNVLTHVQAPPVSGVCPLSDMPRPPRRPPHRWPRRWDSARRAAPGRAPSAAPA